MKTLILASVLALSGCKSMTTVRTIHGPSVMPVPNDNPSIQPEIEHMEVPAFGKILLLGLTGFTCFILWRWDND